jgi:protein TonB
MTRSSGNFLVGSVAFTCLAGLYGNGQPLWVGSAELKQHGITMPDPKLPSSLRAAGKVTVDVLVGPDGRVKCVRAEKGHPLLRQAILDAVKSWTFRPFSAGGHPVSIYAHLDFDFGQ